MQLFRTGSNYLQGAHAALTYTYESIETHTITLLRSPFLLSLTHSFLSLLFQNDRFILNEEEEEQQQHDRSLKSSTIIITLWHRTLKFQTLKTRVNSTNPSSKLK